MKINMYNCNKWIGGHTRKLSLIAALLAIAHIESTAQKQLDLSCCDQ